MGRVTLRLFLSAIATIWLSLTLAFFALRVLPGNAVDAQLQGAGLPASVVEMRRAELNLDQSLITQYTLYMTGILQGEWGSSLYTGQPVTQAIAERLPSTISLAGWAWLLSVGLGIGLGFATLASTPIIKVTSQALIDASLGIPIYVTATLALYFIAGRIGNAQQDVWLPVLVLGYHTSGAIARLVSVTYAETRAAPFIQTARAKGLPSYLITQRHILRLTLLPILPLIALQAGILFSGTVITETIFRRAGLGLLLLDATLERDYPIVQGIVGLTAATYIAFNTLSTLLTHWLDPRLRPNS